jgi:hypothetical protein
MPSLLLCGTSGIRTLGTDRRRRRRRRGCGRRGSFRVEVEVEVESRDKFRVFGDLW